MKMRSRLTALVLAVLMLISTAAPALAADALPLSVYQSMVDSAADQATSQPVIDEGGQVYDLGDTAQPVASGYDTTVEVTLAAGEGEQDVALPVNGKVLLTADIAAGQWQVQVGDQWVNMHGETDSTIEVTFAKVQSLFVMNNAAKLRFISADGSAVSNVANVGLDYSVQTLEEDVAMPMMYKARALNANAGVALAAEEVAEDVPEPEKVVVEIAYVYQNNTTAATSYRAEIGLGDDLTSSVIQLPYIQGYKATFTEAEGVTFVAPTADSNGTIQLKLQDVTQSITYYVTYVPVEVPVTVYHYQMGFTTDKEDSTLVATENLKLLTGSVVGDDLANEYPGFTQLWYDGSVEVAADGSTVIEIYYERNWYLMKFDLDGGYGVDPIYAQYEATVSIGEPERAGYEFGGWEPEVPGTVPVGGGTYVAQWGPETVNYTVVYWKENADDNGYTFWGSEIKRAVAGTKVSGGDTVPTSITTTTVNNKNVDERLYFTFNEGKTDRNITINGDGSSVVNVYYLRNYYTIYFKGYGKCALEAHTHSDACRTMICGYTEEHTHDDACKAVLVCTTTAHTHSAACCTLSTTHTHSTSCYSNVNTNGNVSTNDLQGAPANPVDGQIYQYENDSWFGEDGRKLIYISGTWYRYSGNRNSGYIVQPNNNCPGVHVHGDGNCTCSQAEHTHTDACYAYECGKTQHTHSDECYRDCLTPEHTHTTNCTSNRSDNIIYVVTAKYEQTIGDIWPTYDVLKAGEYAYENNSGNVVDSSGDMFRGWDIPTASNEVVSKRITMTADLCNTTNGWQNATAQYEAEFRYRLYYMFESFDQQSGAIDSDTEGNARRYYTANNKGLWYDSDPIFYQELIYSSNTIFSQKEITGMNPVNVEKTTTGSGDSLIIYNYLYYTRNRSTLSFQNIDTVVKTVSNIMYEQPLANYKDNAGNLLKDFKPDYPETLEPNAYTFAGWYTTPECYEGTEFDFATATMPNGDLTLYADWQPVVHEVTLYISLDELNEDNPEPLKETFEVAHGSLAPKGTFPSDDEMKALGGGKTFVGWFYQVPVIDAEGKPVLDENGEQTYDEKAFAPESMPVRKDMHIYAKWSYNTPINFRVFFRLKDADGNPVLDKNGNYVEVAETLEGRAMYGTTVTVDAKTGKDLYEEYQIGYFPHPPSHSVTVKIAENGDTTVNEYTFWYTKADAVPYRVMYVAYEDGAWKNVADSVLVENNVNVVVTENFKRVAGYMPDKYQKTMIVAYGGETTDDGDYATDSDENIIFFYYTKDTENAFYTVEHYLEPIGGVNADAKWQKYGVTESITGKIGDEYTVTEHTDLTGFSFDSSLTEVDKYDANGQIIGDTLVGAALTQELPEGGMDFRLYYTRKEYPVKVLYVDVDTNELMPGTTAELYTDANNKTTFDYQLDVTVPPTKTFHGYTLVNKGSETITITVDGTTVETIEKNIVTFYYKKTEVEINYVGVDPDGTLITTNEQKETIGSVTPEAEPGGTDGVVTALDGPVAGSTATAASNVYKFAGWYLDEACTQSVPATWVNGNKIVPQKQNLDGDESTAPLYESATYYAKFEYNLTSLTITKSGVDLDKDPDVSFVFNVKGADADLDVAINENGSVTIYGLTVGNKYDVTEVLGNWRYSAADSSQEITLVADADKNVVTFVNTRTSDKWLDGDCYDENVFTAVSQ